jgi:tRNA(Arg) A34 adenosine deaminase TadA
MKRQNRGARWICYFLTFMAFFSLCGRLHGDGNLPTVSTETGSQPPSVKNSATKADEIFIRQAYSLAINAGKRGNHTFGALLVHEGKVILTAENTVNSNNNLANHAEMNLLVKIKRELSPEVLNHSTLYTSTAPCMVCCAAIWYGGAKRVVYGVSYEAFAKLTGLHDTSIPCDKLYQYTGKALDWVGPVLEEEGLQVFRYWPKEDPNSKYFLKNSK